jgi:circadian clock protein KaiC
MIRQVSRPLAATAVSGLDDILAGGLTPNRLYLVEGVPGSGKTTLSLQFLLEGARLGEPVLYVTLSETDEELRGVAEAHGWSLDGLTIRDLMPSEADLQPTEQYTVFHPSEVELGQTVKSILDEVERVKPARVVIDSLSELRLLAGNPLRYRRQILALKQFFVGRSCTVLLLDDMTATDRDLQTQSIAHGVIVLEEMNPEYGGERRRLRVAKLRGRKYRGGFHDFVIRRGGLEVFPRLIAADSTSSTVGERIPSGLQPLDALLGGGLERGTSMLVVGAAGTGKSSIAAQFVSAAAERGLSSAMFLFDEAEATLLSRADGLGIGLRKQVASGRVSIQAIDPAEMSPGELVHRIRAAVEERGVSILVVDSLNGYLNAMPGERHLVIQLHELFSYLGRRGVATILVSVQSGIIGTQMQSAVDASYLADAVLLLRYFEAAGEVRQAISVVKKRGGAHERTIRELRLTTEGIQVGEPLRQFRGVLTGVPNIEPGDGPRGGRA